MRHPSPFEEGWYLNSNFFHEMKPCFEGCERELQKKKFTNKGHPNQCTSISIKLCFQQRTATTLYKGLAYELFEKRKIIWQWIWMLSSQFLSIYFPFLMSVYIVILEVYSSRLYGGIRSLLKALSWTYIKRLLWK